MVLPVDPNSTDQDPVNASEHRNIPGSPEGPLGLPPALWHARRRWGRGTPAGRNPQQRGCAVCWQRSDAGMPLPQPWPDALQSRRPQTPDHTPAQRNQVSKGPPFFRARAFLGLFLTGGSQIGHSCFMSTLTIPFFMHTFKSLIDSHVCSHVWAVEQSTPQRMYRTTNRTTKIGLTTDRAAKIMLSLPGSLSAALHGQSDASKDSTAPQWVRAPPQKALPYSTPA